MNAKVAVYDSHDKAIEAVCELEAQGFPVKQVSIVGKAEIIDDHIHVKSLDMAKNAPVLVGTGAGVIVGILTGLGVFAIPGFGPLYGAGAVVGALAGLDFGLIGGGLVTLLATIGIKEESVVKYRQHMKEGKFIVVVQGTLDQINQAEQIIHSEGTHLEFGE